VNHRRDDVLPGARFTEDQDIDGGRRDASDRLLERLHDRVVHDNLAAGELDGSVSREAVERAHLVVTVFGFPRGDGFGFFPCFSIQ
jgi:hypothetical protein